MHRIILAVLLAGALRAAILIEIPATSYPALTAAGDSLQITPASLLVTNGWTFVPMTLTVEFTFGGTLEPRQENTIPLSFPVSFDGETVLFPASAFFGPNLEGTQVQGVLTLRNGLGSIVALGDSGGTVEESGTILIPLPEPSTYGLAGAALLLLVIRKVRASRSSRRQ